MLTQRGAKPSFPIFLICQKNFFWSKGGHGPMAPLNTPLVSGLKSRFVFSKVSSVFQNIVLSVRFKRIIARDVRPRGLASASRPKNLASASASASWVVASASASASASWVLASASWVLASSLEASRGLYTAETERNVIGSKSITNSQKSLMSLRIASYCLIHSVKTFIHKNIRQPNL